MQMLVAIFFQVYNFFKNLTSLSDEQLQNANSRESSEKLNELFLDYTGIIMIIITAHILDMFHLLFTSFFLGALRFILLMLIKQHLVVQYIFQKSRSKALYFWLYHFFLQNELSHVINM